jgi:tetratricopeptide (TPR) repeat protein
LTSIFYSALRWHALDGHVLPVELNSDPLLLPASYLYAFARILFPSGSLQYEPELMEWFGSSVLIAVLIAVCMVLMIFQKLGAYRSSLVPALLTILFLGLLPTANIFIQETPFDERHLLTSLFAATALIGWIVARLAERSSFSVAYVFVPLILMFTYFSIRRGEAFVSDQAFLNRWVESAPQQAKVVCFQALQALLNEDYQRALTFADKSIELRENNLALLYRARINIKLNNIEAARRDLIRSAELSPQNIDVRCEQALLADHANDRDRANSLFIEIGKEDPNIWCLGGKERLGAGNFWGQGLTFSKEQLQRLPLTSREQLRRYHEIIFNH